MAISSWFTHWSWWFSIVMLVYQRVLHSDKRKTTNMVREYGQNISFDQQKQWLELACIGDVRWYETVVVMLCDIEVHWNHPLQTTWGFFSYGYGSRPIPCSGVWTYMKNCISWYLMPIPAWIKWMKPWWIESGDECWSRENGGFHKLGYPQLS